MSDQRSGPIHPDEREEVLAELYDELRRAARRMLDREAPNLTLQPTELVNEAAIRVMKLDRMSWNDRQHFFATGARILRQAMMDAIRRRRSLKRHMPTVFISGIDEAPDMDLEALDEALDRLGDTAPELARIVELRFFVGLGIAEIAAITDQSDRTVKRRWQTARLWLASELSPT
jgi:RNA polymerase sigma factor (TIGR02999 family)